jgi:hypothetical protein
MSNVRLNTRRYKVRDYLSLKGIEIKNNKCRGPYPLYYDDKNPSCMAAKISLDKNKLDTLRRVLTAIEGKIDDASLSQECKLGRVDTLLLEAEHLIASMITVEYEEANNG